MSPLSFPFFSCTASWSSCISAKRGLSAFFVGYPVLPKVLWSKSDSNFWEMGSVAFRGFEMGLKESKEEEEEEGGLFWILARLRRVDICVNVKWRCVPGVEDLWPWIGLGIKARECNKRAEKTAI